jgi:hypothetical protein
MVHSYQTTNYINRYSCKTFAMAETLLILQVCSTFVVKLRGDLNKVGAVLPPSKRVALMPDDVTESTNLFLKEN